MATGKYKGLRNEEYWSKRSEERVSQHWKDLKNVEKAMATQYRLAMDDIRGMTTDLYARYATEEGITYQDAIQRLNAVEMSDYKAKIERMLPTIRQTGNPELIAEFEKLQKAGSLNRMQALMGQIDARLLELGHSQQMEMEDWLSGLYEKNYYQTVHQVQRGTGIGASFSKLNEDAIRQAITMPFKGDIFSERIWDNRTQLVKNLRQTITQNLIQGQSVQKMARSLSKTMDSGYSQSLRLIRTESAHVIEESTAQGYENSGIVEQYQIIATLDDRTSSICQSKDGNVYDLKDKEVGVNYPPFHPSCRTTVAPYFSDDEDPEDLMRMARGEDGELYEVPANISYDRWLEEYVN